MVFTDVVGSTALAARVGDEAANELRRQHFTAIEMAVAATGGEIIKTMGDGAMCVYRSAADALAGAVALQRVVARGADHDTVAIRVGVAAGDATFENGDWFGVPVVTAARLCAAAPDGGVLATQLVAALAGSLTDVELRDAGALDLKGLPDPVPCVEVRWQTERQVTDVPTSLASDSRAFTFVGRQHELEVLHRTWKEATTGTRRAVFLGGEPGVGKTRLAAQLAGRAAADGGVVLHGRCDENLAAPFLPFVEVVRARLTALAPTERRVETLSGGRELKRLLPELDDLIPGLPPPTRADVDTELRLTFEALDAMFAAASVKAPLLVVLDDLHWADPSTIDLLRHLLRSETPAFVCILATYRDREVPDDHPLRQLLGEAPRLLGTTVVPLSGLDPECVEALVADASGGELDAAGAELAAAIHAETAGNPFFVGEVVRHVAESGAGADAVPTSVRDVVASRLARLSPETNAALRVGAVAGSPFTLQLIEAVAGGDQLDALDEAVAAAVVTEPAPGQYAFTHALTRQAVLDALSAGRRMRLHRDVGRALAAQPDVERHLAALAHHFAEAAPDGTANEAARYALAAGRAAIASLAIGEADTLLARGVAIADSYPDVDPECVCDLFIALAQLGTLGSANPADSPWGQRAVDTARPLGSPTRFAQAVIWRTYNFHAGHDDDGALALIDEALAGLGDDEVYLRVELQASVAAYYAIANPDPERARAMSAETMVIAEQLPLKERAGAIGTRGLHAGGHTDRG